MPSIDLYYHRPGCISCKRTRELLDSAGAQIAHEQNSKKQTMTDAEATALLKSVTKVIIAKGKSTTTLKAADATLDNLRGPTGGFRAPILQAGKTLLVGFHPDSIRDLLNNV